MSAPPCVSGRDPTHHNISSIAPLEYACVTTSEGDVVYFRGPVRMCVWCGKYFGYPLDPRRYEQTDGGRTSELVLCEAAQRRSR